MSSGLCVALVGAESTGKTTLALSLAARLGEVTGLRCAAVGEYLREWCDARGRTPRAEEQQAIAEEQQRCIEAALQQHDLVIADTTPLMTAVYSELLFDDPSLYGFALQAHRGYAITLLTALDLPWTPDGHQRDGPHVREPVDRAVRAALLGAGLDWSVVSGAGESRVASALNAITPLLLSRRPDAGSGLFTRLQSREAAMPAWQWVCEKCDVPDCEHQALRHNRPQ
jgi:nicotinamide riboside kinase